VEALVTWAFAHPDVRRVVAQTLPELRSSIRVLEKSGFTFIGPGFEEGALLFERLRPAARDVVPRPAPHVVNLEQKLALFAEHWSPKVVGELNGQQVKVVKLKGEFIWHHHDDEDELFFVVRGTLRMRLRDKELTIRPGEFLIVPRGVEHLPVADEECHVMLFEPASTLNTGEVRNERTVEKLERL
jgi:mannose-6-phosphate isomerase-like protein (cupin superfamily)